MCKSRILILLLCIQTISSLMYAAAPPAAGAQQRADDLALSEQLARDWRGLGSAVSSTASGIGSAASGIAHDVGSALSSTAHGMRSLAQSTHDRAMEYLRSRRLLRESSSLPAASTEASIDIGSVMTNPSMPVMPYMMENLPVRTLMRLRLVSQAWKKAIDENPYVQKHLHLLKIYKDNLFSKMELNFTSASQEEFEQLLQQLGEAAIKMPLSKEGKRYLQINFLNCNFDEIPGQSFKSILQLIRRTLAEQANTYLIALNFESATGTIEQGTFDGFDDMISLSISQPREFSGHGEYVNQINAGAFRGLKNLAFLTLILPPWGKVESSTFEGLKNVVKADFPADFPLRPGVLQGLHGLQDLAIGSFSFRKPGTSRESTDFTAIKREGRAIFRDIPSLKTLNIITHNEPTNTLLELCRTLAKVLPSNVKILVDGSVLKTR